MGLSVDANGLKLIGGDGYQVEARVNFFNETREQIVVSQSGADFAVLDSSGSVITEWSETDRPDAILVLPGDETRFKAAFHTNADLHNSMHFLRVSICDGKYVATCTI